MDGASPVSLSSCGEKERQWHIASKLARLIGLPLDSTGLEGSLVPTLGAGAGVRDDTWQESELEELQRLRVDVHGADLEKCSSQKRMACLHWAVRKDSSLLGRQMELHSESERQHFWNDIHSKIKSRDFAGFNFTGIEFDAYWKEECSRRAETAAPRRERLAELEVRREAKLQQLIGECAERLSIFDWSVLPPSLAIEPRVDALAMQGPDKIWVAAEVRQPLTSAGFARDFVLVVDLSGSMCDVMDLLKDCLQDIVSRARNDDRMCVIGFSCQPHLLCDWTIMADQEARTRVRNAIDGMASHGGTHLVPALKMVEEQFSQLQAFPTPTVASERPTLQLMPCLRAPSHGPQAVELQPPPAPRVPAVILLSDGDPEEPAEAVYTACCSALDAAPGCKASLVSLSLGDGSNPALMALTAQCGGGPALYIARNSQLPEQLGRMWGYLGTLVQPRDLFLVLTPVGDAQILEVERPLGGSVELCSSDGQQFVIMSCGSAVAGSVQRFVSQLKLPTWLSTRAIDEHALQAPLLRMTWVWQLGLHGAVESTSTYLRVLQVPSLLVEATLGLPVRVTIDTEWHAGLDHGRFLGALAQSLNLPAERLMLDRLSPGSIIADLRIMDVTPSEFQVVKAACKTDTEEPTEACAALSASGFPVKSFSLPGGSTFQRVLQWHLARALEDVVENQGCGRLGQVQHLAISPLASQLDPEGKAASVYHDAAAAKTEFAKATTGSEGTNHALLQQAYAHCQQICPELEPGAAAVAGYELQALRTSAAAFSASAAHREAPPSLPPAAVLELASGQHASQLEGELSVQLRAEGEGAATVTAFRVELRAILGSEAGNAGHDLACTLTDPMVNSFMAEGDASEAMLVEDVPAAAGDVMSGILHTFRGFPAGMPLQLRAAAFTTNGQLGPWSSPMLGRASVPPAPIPAVDTILSTMIPEPVPEPLRSTIDVVEAAPPPNAAQSPSKARKQQAVIRRRSNTRRSLSTTGQGPEIQIVNAEAKLGRFSLSWNVKGEVQPEPGKRWIVTFTPNFRGAPLRMEVDAQHLEVDNLAASKCYRFRIEAVPERPQESAFGCVQGSSIARRVIIQAAEGTVLTPPFNEALLNNYSNDPMLQQLFDGVFVRLSGPKA